MSTTAAVLDGKTAIVTGGARGIGLVYIRALADRGAHVVAADIVGPSSGGRAAAGLDDGGAVAHVWPADKAAWLRQLSARLAVPYDRTAAVGDSSGDLPMLRAAAVRVYVGRQPPPETCVHLPLGRIDDVARSILEQWEIS